MAKLEGQRQSSLSQLKNQITVEQNREPWYYYYVKHVWGLIAFSPNFFFLNVILASLKTERKDAGSIGYVCWKLFEWWRKIILS